MKVKFVVPDRSRRRKGAVIIFGKLARKIALKLLCPDLTASDGSRLRSRIEAFHSQTV